MWINYTNFCWKSWLISEFIISKWWINDSTRRLILNHYHKLILWLTTNHQAQRIERQIITNANLNFSSLSQHSFQKLNHLFGISKFLWFLIWFFFCHTFYFLIDFYPHEGSWGSNSRFVKVSNLCKSTSNPLMRIGKSRASIRLGWDRLN